MDKIKISQLELEENINEESLIPIVQNNKTKAIKSKDLLKDLDGRINSIDSQLDNITDKTTKINMISEDGTSWILYIDNYGQIGVIKEVE